MPTLPSLFHPLLLSLAFGAVVLTTTAPAQTVLQEFPGPSRGASMGNALASGDVNGDGSLDMIVGIRNATVGMLSKGRIQVFSGSSGAVLLDVTGLVTNAGFGFSVTFVGDTNGDGFGEIAVGAPFHSGPGEVQNGRAFLICGQSGNVLWDIAGTTWFEFLGHSVCGLSDVNGDFVPDLAVGAIAADGSFPDSGQVRVISGANGALLYLLDGFDPGDQFGTSITAFDDLDGDGRGDFAIGAKGRDFPLNGAGSVTVYSGQLGVQLYEKFGSVASQGMGHSLASLQDMDGDGIQDWIAGSPDDSTTDNQAGSFVVHSGLSGSFVFGGFGDGSNQRLGAQVSSAGDMDADGRGDWAVAATGDSSLALSGGRVDIYSGLAVERVCSLLGSGDLERLGSGLCSLGDYDGDGVVDLGVGLPGSDTAGADAGGARIYAGCRMQGIEFCQPAVPNSTGFPGRVRASGSIDVSKNRLTLMASDLPPLEFGYFLLGSASGFIPNVGGSQGTLCLGGTLGRYNLSGQIRQVNTRGGFSLDLDLAHLPLIGGPPVLAGQTWHFQAWYRDHNPSNTSNLTSALVVSFP